MDKEMVRFAGNNIDSNFAQHLIVVWNAFNITKQFYPNYIKADVAYVVFQKFIRDNWDSIRDDLESFDLIWKDNIVEKSGNDMEKSGNDMEKSGGLRVMSETQRLEA